MSEMRIMRGRNGVGRDSRSIGKPPPTIFLIFIKYLGSLDTSFTSNLMTKKESMQSQGIALDVFFVSCIES